MIPYQDDFSCWAEVQGAYNMSDPEPEKVFLATYKYEDYSGSSDVFYYDKGKYYWVSGGHCSCYGLEGQWEPTEYDNVDELLNAIGKYWRDFSHLEAELHSYPPKPIQKTPLEI